MAMATFDSTTGDDSSLNFESEQGTESMEFPRIKFHTLPIMNDKKTEMYVKFAKVMIIFQRTGSVGEMKELIKAIDEKFKQAHFEISEAKYMEIYRENRVKDRTEFLGFCKSRAKEACEKGTNLIVINHFERNRDTLMYFVHLAQRAKYLVLVYPPMVTQEDRGYSYSTCYITDHFFCSWYLNDVDSEELRDLASMYFNDCLSSIMEFRKFYEKVDEDNDFNSFYGLNVKKQDLAHCIMKLFTSVVSAFQYFKREEVMKNYGKMSYLQIVGFVFSPSIIAARVKVSYNQRSLYEMRDEIKSEHDMKQFPSQLQHNTKINLDEKLSLSSSKCKRTLEDTRRTIHDPIEHVRGKGRAAHIVLGKSKRAIPADIDYDVLHAVTREGNVAKNDVIIHDIRNGFVRKLGKYWMVYLKESLQVDAMFGSCFKV